MINENATKPKDIPSIPDDLSGTIAITQNDQVLKYIFEDGRLQSVSVEYLGKVGVETINNFGK